MTKGALTSIAGACLFLAAIFFLPCLTPGVSAQITSRSEVVGDDELMPSAYPSRLLGAKLPTKIDLRSEMPPVADQGDANSQSCVFFATVYYQMTQAVKHFKHPEWDLKNPEHQFSVPFARSKATGLPSPPSAYASLMQFGCVDAAEMQYNQWSVGVQPTANQLEAAKPYLMIGGYAALWDYGFAPPPYNPPNPIQNAKAWLADGYVLVISIDPNSPGFPGQSGICTPPTPFFDTIDPQYNYNPGHQVAICGYNDNINPKGKGPDHRGGFLMVNSEGLEWNGNMHGYIWLSYAYVKQYIPDCWIMIMGGGSDAPVITGCTRQDTGIGYLVTISGTNFGSFRRSAGVTINGVRPWLYMTWTNESVTVSVPYCVTSGPVVLYNWENAPSNSVPLEQ